MLGVAAQDGRLQVTGADHVVRDEQEFLPLHPAVLDAGPLQPLPGAQGAGVVLEEQVEDGHEVRLLPGTEATVEVGRLAAHGVLRPSG